MQRAIANDHDVVIDGRDSGSVVFPHAEHKFFLTASEDERAWRWKKQQEQRGEVVTLAQAKQFVNSRDARDSSRAIAPLKKPEGSAVIDGTQMSIDEVVERIIQAIA